MTLIVIQRNVMNNRIAPIILESINMQHCASLKYLCSEALGHVEM